MKKIVTAAFVLLSLAGLAHSAPSPSKKTGTSTKPLCAEDTCVKLKNAVMIAMEMSKLEVIIAAGTERSSGIESATAQVMEKTKGYKDEVRPLYAAALASVKRSEKATSALKEFMMAWNAGINSFPMSLLASRAEQAEDYKKHVQRLNDAWARVELEAEL